MKPLISLGFVAANHRFTPTATLRPIAFGVVEKPYFRRFSCVFCGMTVNPIEKMWSKIKALLRSAKARTPTALNDAIAAALAAITPEDAAVGLPHAATVLFNML